MVRRKSQEMYEALIRAYREVGDRVFHTCLPSGRYIGYFSGTSTHCYIYSLICFWIVVSFGIGQTSDAYSAFGLI